MTIDPTGGRDRPTTPIYDETVEAIAVDGDQGTQRGTSGTADRAKQQAAETASQAKDTARETAGAAKDQAGQVAGAARDAGSRVAGTTKDQANRVAKDALGQARDLYGQATSELSEQAGKQQRSAASALHSLGDDLGRMHQADEGGGLAAELVQNLSRRASQAASWLEDREPADVLDEVKQFAARRPGLFIGLAAVAGVIGARATKALIADAKPDTGASGGRTSDGLAGSGAGRTSSSDVPVGDDGFGRSVVHEPGTPSADLGGVR